MPVHSNGYVTTQQYGQKYANYGQNYTASSGYGNWAVLWYHASTAWGNWEYVGGYSQHSNYGQNYYYDGQGIYYTNTDYNSVNMSPTISGSVSAGSGTIAAASITIDLSGITYTDPEGTARSSSSVYYTFSQDGVTYGNPVLLGTTTTNSYVWDLTPMSGGYYKIYVTMSDGSSSSATVDTQTGQWIADYTQVGTEGTVVDTTAYNTVSYCSADPVRIIKYTPPEWSSYGVKADNVDELQEEINKARDSFGLSAFVFSNTSLVNNFSKVLAQDVQELQTASNQIYVTSHGTDYEFDRTITSSDVNITKAEHNDYEDIKELLESL